MDFVYDIETYKNFFSFSILNEDNSIEVALEVSVRKNEISRVKACLEFLKKGEHRMVGFNNLGFDYPVIHEIMQNYSRYENMDGEDVAREIYIIAQEQINTGRTGFSKTIPFKDEMVRQIDLFKIHHFDNKARATSLKLLEFNMRSQTIQDLPYHHGNDLETHQMDDVIKYNLHDVRETMKFYKHSKSAIAFREILSAKYETNYLNHNDTKIGKDYFIMELEKAMPGSCYKIDSRGFRKINQTKRPYIDIRDCLFNYYTFSTPEFQAVLAWFKRQRIKETKGVFSDIEEHRLGDVARYATMVTKKEKFKSEPTPDEIKAFKEVHPKGWIESKEMKATEWLLDEDGNHVMVPDEKKPGKMRKARVAKLSWWGMWSEAENLNVMIDGFRFDFGTGGIHGSIESGIVEHDEEYEIIDADVSSMYPNIGISNRVYPEHLSEKFCDIYEDVYQQRKSFPKTAPENGMLKLALNGVYGDSNNEFSPFYDPKYTMTITINGQLSLCLLAEQLMTIQGLSLIQVNTDGVTVKIPRNKRSEYDAICQAWQKQVKLELEFAEYSKMIIRDVNNYIAIYTNGKVKRKGAYQYEGLGWHQNQGGLVIPRAAEAVMLHNVDLEEFIKEHAKKDHFDFLLRTKVPRSSKLVMTMGDGTEVLQQNICRYYPSKKGGKLVKIMPPLEGETEERRISVESDYNVKTCNDMNDFDGDFDFDYYVAEARKLIIE